MYQWGSPDKRLLKGNRVLCPHCEKSEANLHSTLGVLPCNNCQERQGQLPGLSKVNIEFVPDRIKEDRKKHKTDTLQPHREGYASKEFINAYPQEAKRMFTPKEMKGAKNVWTD